MSADNYYAVIPAGNKFAVRMGFMSNDDWPSPREGQPLFDTVGAAIAEADRLDHEHWSEYGIRLHPEVSRALAASQARLSKETSDG